MIHDILTKGVDEELNEEMLRRVRMLNITALVSMSVSFLIGITNTIQHNWLQLISNGIIFSFSAFLYLTKSFRHFNATIYVLLAVISLYFFFNGVLFHNSMQYALMLVMAFSILTIDDKRGRFVLLGFAALLLLLYVYLQDRPAIIKPVPIYRHLIVTACILFAFSCLLEYFRGRQLNYRQNLSAMNEQLKAGNTNKERMLSILSHDFNSPVKNLIYSLQLIDEQILTQEQFADVSARLQAQLKALTVSLEDVLNWSKMQLSGNPEQAVSQNINAILNEILPLFQYSLQEKNIRIQNKIGDEVTAWANSDHLKLIFRNLLSNSIKFSHPRGIIFLCAQVSGGTVTICVKDEGTGIKPTILQSLNNGQLNFTSNPGTANEKGTGLGLMLVREFLQKNNGRLTIESEYGKGSTFSVTLPANANDT